MTLLVEHDDHVPGRVAHVDARTRRVHRDTPGRLEIGFPALRAFQVSAELAVRIENQYGSRAAVSYVHIAVSIGGQTHRTLEAIIVLQQGVFRLTEIEDMHPSGSEIGHVYPMGWPFRDRVREL